MKKFIITLFLIFTTANLFCQELIPFTMNKNSMSATYEVVDNKSKERYILRDSVSLESGDFYNGTATMYSFINGLSDGNSRMKMPVLFENGETIVDISTAMSESMAQMMTQQGDELSAEEQQEAMDFVKDIKVTGRPKGIPLELVVGEELPEYEVTIDMGFISTKMRTYDRNVVRRENITTPAGTFDCYVIEETSSIKAMFMSEKEYSRRWYSRGIGVVQEETLDKRGRVLQVKTLKEISVD